MRSLLVGGDCRLWKGLLDTHVCVVMECIWDLILTKVDVIN